MVSPEAIAAAWATWRSRHGGKLGPGPGPAFAEAIAAAVAVDGEAIRRAGRIVGLREAAQIADQWSEARLDEANAPILSGDVFADTGVFVQSTADAHAGYRLLDLSKAIRARIAALEAGEEGK